MDRRARTRSAPTAPALALVLAAVVSAAAAPPAPAAAQVIDAADLAGLDFRAIGPANMSGRIVDLAVYEADPRVFWAASATGGVWKTVNNGVTWTPVFESQGTHSIGDIEVSQRDTSLVWVGTGERASRQSNSWGDGVYRSTDGGATWTNMGLEDSHHVGRIVLDPRDDDVVFVAAMGHLWGPNDERGLYKSTDGGGTWRRVLAVDEDTGVSDVAIDPDLPDVMYAATYQRRRRPFGFDGGGPGSGLWKSTDGGETWRRLGPSSQEVPARVAAYDGRGDAPTVNDARGLPVGEWGRVGISIHRADPRIVYASIEQGWRFNASTAYVESRGGTYRSEDRGETWEQMSDFNPRPMYGSQPLVDPNDDQRIYHMNFFSVSTDGGRTFEGLRQSLHGDDRILWVDPADSRHLVKGDDGGIGISWDRAETWLYVTNLPLAQYYRVRVDNQVPYNVYGGLQDNGAWVGPSETYRSEGILNEDWTRLGGGDGFLALPDTTDPDRVYAESQYLGLTRLDMRTGERQDIRPGDPTGHIGDRRNFDAWFGGDDDPDFMNAMEPANWDGPYIVSPHDPDVLYAGTQRLWRSDDGGRTWTDLGDVTGGVDRRTLPIMGRLPDDLTPSVDDGAPYWPTATIVRESPLVRHLLYVGTDDGRLLVSREGGALVDVADALPGLPEMAWMNGIEPSRHVAGRVYAVANNYRNDDYGNYVWRSEDFGRTWRRIDGGLPPERVARTLREDPRDPDVLYLGTELGLFLSVDGGATWMELRGDMPTLPFNDLVIQERENDLVLGTHGRGVWILDQINALQELNDVPAGATAHLFTLQPARQIRYWGEKAHEGDMAYHGENPPEGAPVDYWLARERGEGEVALEVLDGAGRPVATVPDPPRAEGLNRAVWDLRHARLDGPARPGRPGPGGPAGPLVVPGTYTVRLTVDGTRHERTVEVREDPRVTLAADARRRWTEDQLRVAELYERVADLSDRVAPLARRARATLDTTRAEDVVAPDAAEARTPGEAEARARAQEAEPLPRATALEVEAVAGRVGELVSRVARLYFDVGSWTGPMTGDQASREAYYRQVLPRLEGEVAAVAGRAGG